MRVRSASIETAGAITAASTSLPDCFTALGPSLGGDQKVHSGSKLKPRFLQRPDGRVAYEDAGDGPLVVMVPGLGDLLAEYRYLAPKLVTAGYRVVTLDLRGHGQSSVGWPDYTSAALGCQSASKFDPRSASNSNPAGIDAVPPFCGFIRSGS